MKIETKYDIASSVNIGAEYDKGVKKLFKSKEIIVPIMNTPFCPGVPADTRRKEPQNPVQSEDRRW